MLSADRCIIGMAAIGETCRGLTSIDMSCNSNMTDVGISYLAQGCIHVQSINIGGSCSQLTDASLVAIGESCRGLTSINVSANINMTDGGISCHVMSCLGLSCPGMHPSTVNQYRRIML